jgi:hypothetical protein
MRKLLMASAAILGASGGLASAQTLAPAAASQGQYAGPYGAGPAPNNNNNAWGIANTPSGSKAAGPLSTIYAPNTIAVPAPGTIVIRLNGRVEVDVSANFTSVDRSVSATGTPTGLKLNPVGVSSYMRLYPGFDGVAANGLRSGAAFELRENFQSGIGNGFGTNGTTAASPSTNSSLETVSSSAPLPISRPTGPDLSVSVRPTACLDCSIIVYSPRNAGMLASPT